MSRNAKIILAIVAALLVICMCAVVGTLLFIIPVTRSMSGPVQEIVRVERPVWNDEQEMPQVEVVRPEIVIGQDAADKVPEFDVPAGWIETFHVGIGGLSMVGYNSPDDYGHIYVGRFPAGTSIDAERMRNRAHRAMGQWGDWSRQLKPVGTLVVRIGAQEVVFGIAEGTNNEGMAYREVVGVFDDAGSPVLVVYSRPIADWNQQELDAFLQSIR